MTIQAGVGIGLDKDPAQSAIEAVRQARTNIGSKKIDLALVFTSIELATTHVIKAVGELLGQIPMLGCSAAALISDKGIFQHGIAVMLLSFPEGVYFNTCYCKDADTKSGLACGE